MTAVTLSPSSQLSIITDLISSSFDFKSLCKRLSCKPPPNYDHHYWHFGGLRSYTIPFESDEDDNDDDNDDDDDEVDVADVDDDIDDELTIKKVMSELNSIQNSPSPFPPFWILHKKCSQQQINSLPTSPEVIKKNQRLGKFDTNSSFRIELMSGALVRLNKFVYDTKTEINDGYRLTFYHDRIDLDYGDNKEYKLRKTLKADMMDRCAVIMKKDNSFTLFINMSGNLTEYKGLSIDEKNQNVQDLNSPQQHRKYITYTRMASQQAQPFYSTIRLVVSFENENLDEENSLQQKRHLNYCYKKFIEFFNRNYINDCFGVIHSTQAREDFSKITSQFMNNQTMSFIKQYCWHMLLSTGFRFQQRLTQNFIDRMSSIEDDDEFYQTSLHIWRRSNEYYFIDLVGELNSYQDKIRAFTLLSASCSTNNQYECVPQRWSIHNPPVHYAYVPSVTLTPTTISVKPFKLVKTNRVLREENFGGNLMFSLVDVKDENGTKDIFPHDYRALRSKIETLLEYGFDVGRKGRTYRYLHHSQSQLKDKQFWFYFHNGGTNFSFEEAFAWMGDFQDEKIVAKHSARIAQCFTSAEATITIPSELVEYIEDIRTNDRKYNFTDGAGTMSTFIRDSINPHRKFSAIQIRYGGCKGVISVNPELDDKPQQLRIRQSMKKFKCDHNILESCRISKPRPLYLNRQIIVLLSHRAIDDRRFLSLQNEHQQILSEALVYPHRAYELLSEKLNRTLFPLRKLTNEAQINLIQEPFFRQLLIAIGKFELIQIRERTRLKLPKNTARNLIGVVDEYGVLEYGQVFIQYTELNDDYVNNTESEKAIILQQKVVVTKNPCYHPGDIRVFTAVDAPRLRHLKDVIVFPQRGIRPHPNEISGSDLDGDEYAVIWHPAFIPETPNNIPFDYDSQTPMLRVVDRPIYRSDIQATVLDISEQCCVGKLCSLHLANMDLHGVADKKTLTIAGYISEELDAAKTGHHPLTPTQIAGLQEKLGNKRPDYFDKPYYELYPSTHVLGQLFRSCLRFEPNWTTLQTPPTTIQPSPIDPLLVHDLHSDYTASVEELAHIYRESIMDIIYVYKFSSDIDLLCRFDSSTPQYKTPLTKQQIDSACLVADSAHVELKQLIRRMHRLFYQEFRLKNKLNHHRCRLECTQCAEKKMAKASALYIFCYSDTRHARRMISLPWLFSTLLMDVRKLNIEKQRKLVSPALVAQMLEIQPYRLIGQSLRHAAQFIIDVKKNSYFQYSHSLETPTMVTLSIGPTTTAKRLLRKLQISLIDYLLIEIIHHFVYDSISPNRPSIISSKPTIVESAWQHILTRFVCDKCSPLVLITSTNLSLSPLKNFLNVWSDEKACLTFQRLIDISVKCSDHGPNGTDYAHANEYLVLMLQKMATTDYLFSN